MDLKIIKAALACKCPKCGKGDLFKSGFLNLGLRANCDVCGLDFSKNDSGDGPAVFLIFILGFALVPLALLMEVLLSPPLWAHALVWGVIAIGLTVGSFKPLKSYIIALQYKHRAGDFE